MTTFRTMNPTGSKSPKDLSDNAENLDYLMLGPLSAYEDRRGASRLSWKGIEASFLAAQSERAAAFQKFLDGTGWTSLGAYGAGVAITSHTQTVDYQGQPYQLKPSIPASLESPYVTTGIWATEGVSFKLVGDNSLRQDLASPDIGMGMIQGKVTDASAVATTLINWLGKKVHAGANFGADIAVGSAAQTAKLKAFYNYCISTGTGGHIPRASSTVGGVYSIVEGQLAFDCNGVDTPLPHITTDGHFYVTFQAAGINNLPLLSFSNGTATSGVGKYYQGGSHGGITFKDVTGHTATGRHGLSLRGVWGTRFGWMRGDGLRGDLVNIPEALLGGTNPDPYAVTSCAFDALEANYCGFALNNRNWLGFNGCTVGMLRVVGCRLGAWYGFGTMNRVLATSLGSNAGWQFDDGLQLAATGGASLRFDVDGGELDDVQYGIRINRTRQANFKNIRFVHRHNNNPLNPGQGYWPRVAVSIGGGTASASSELYFNISHRIEAGGLKAAMGVFVDLHNDAQLANIELIQRYNDNAGLGFTNSDFVSNLNDNARVYATVNAFPVVDTRIKAANLARASASQSIGISGFPSETGKVIFPTALGVSLFYDVANGYFVVPQTGKYWVSGRINIALPVGTRLRLGLSRILGGASQPVILAKEFSNNAAAYSRGFSGQVLLTAGSQVYFTADQNSGAPVALTVEFSAEAENTWSVAAI